MEKERCYFVIDMKSFFASVECAERGLDAMTTDLLVADPTRCDTTICLAVSPSLKAKGVKNRCRLYEVPKNLDYIVATPRMKKYIEYAAEVYAIYLQYIDKSDIHVYSIDECFIDVTDYLKIYKMRAKEFAKMLMSEIHFKLGIPSSCGIGTNLYLAKIALDITAKKSPDRIGYLTEDLFLKTMWNHKPLSDFWGISTGTIERLKKYGIHDMKGIATCEPELLYREFGINAELMIDHSWGKESCLMSDIKSYKSKSKSISNSQILACNYGFKDAKIVLTEMVQEACYRLAKEKLITSHIVIGLGYGDECRTVVKGSARTGIDTNLFSQIMPVAEKLMYEIADKTMPIRRLALSFGGLISAEFQQQDFFTDFERQNKERRLVDCILELKDRFGKNAVLKALDFEEYATQIERNGQIGGHKSGENENAKTKQGCTICPV